HLPKDQDIDTILPRLVQAAVLQLETGFMTAAQLEALAAGSGDTADITAMLSSMEPEDTEEATDENTAKTAKSQKDESASVYARLLTALRRTGLIVEHRGGRYQFRHSFITAYLASLRLTDAAFAVDKALDPVWSQS